MLGSTVNQRERRPGHDGDLRVAPWVGVGRPAPKHHWFGEGLLTPPKRATASLQILGSTQNQRERRPATIKSCGRAGRRPTGHAEGAGS
jgi:hypothetical protein